MWLFCTLFTIVAMIIGCSEQVENSISEYETGLELVVNPLPDFSAEENLTDSDEQATNAMIEYSVGSESTASPILISVSEGHSMVIMPDGSLWAWGWNYFGELGDGTTYNRSAPVQIGTDTDWASVVAGAGFTVALKSDGSLWAWGASWDDIINRNLGPTAYRITAPEQIGTDTDWAHITAGLDYVVIIKNDGSLWAWGRNTGGNLGDGTTTDRYMPIQIGTDTDWASVTASTNSTHTLALKTDGSLWAWGWNGGGQFGDGTSADRYTPRQTPPVQIGTDTDWAHIVTSGSHTAAIKTDGSLWTWGSNSDGQLGDGTTDDRFTPAQIGTDTDWVSVVVGGGTTVAIKNDGSLWAWGMNQAGRLGVGVEGTVSWDDDWEGNLVLTPTQVGTDTDWANVTTGIGRTVAIKSDGSLWSWGWAGELQRGFLIGDGKSECRNSPVKILDGIVP